MKVTVGEIIRRVFPTGTNLVEGKVESDASVSRAPLWPPDAFAASAFLLERAGIYQLLSPGRVDRWIKPWFTLSDADVELWRKTSTEWRATCAVPGLVQELWTRLVSVGETAKLSRFPGLGKEPPEWTLPAFALMFIADEASRDVGYVRLDADPATTSWVNMYDVKAESAWVQDNAKGVTSKSGHVLLTRHRYTITQMTSQDMLAVQPKARTSQVGATLRTMSQHLALLPPPSRMGATWQRIASSRDEIKPDLNLLLVPFPYQVDPEWFHAVPDGVRTASGGAPDSGWGWFDIDQRWLPKDPSVLTDFISALIRQAESDCPDVKVDGVILPEYSITWDHHQHLVEFLADKHPEVEFLVSGSGTNCEKAEGNFALTSSINRTASVPSIQTNSRGKHHRWRLEKGQIESYGLGNKLDSNLLWWEGIALHRRQIHTHVFRDGSAFTTFICEDLARSDPGHETVRALGPSIVFCLLMDNVQIPVRWPGRYASILSEDPGSAVLTFTSRGLIEQAVRCDRRNEGSRDMRQRANGDGYARSSNWAVGMWRDDKSGRAFELHCPPNDHAVLLRLRGDTVEDSSYDDRRDSEGTRWVYSEACAVRLSDEAPALVALRDSERISVGEDVGSASATDEPARADDGSGAAEASLQGN